MDLGALFDDIAGRDIAWVNDTNSTNVSDENINFLERYPIMTYIYLSILGPCTVVGNIGNMMVIGAVSSYKPLRTTGNLFIANLALADLCVTSIVDPFSIIGVIEGPSFFKDKWEICDLVASLCMISCTCSLWNITAVAVDRFVFLCQHQRYRDIFTFRKTTTYCIILWLGCVAMEVPNLTGWGGHAYDMKTMACSYDRLADITYTYFFASVGICIPLIIVCVTYVKIFLYVCRIRRNVMKMAAGVTKGEKNFRSRQQDEFQLARTLFVVCIVFIVCWSPYVLVILIDSQDEWSRIAYVVSIQLAHTSSSINSILYGTTNKRFRKGYLCFINSIIICLPIRRRMSPRQQTEVSSLSQPSNFSQTNKF